MLRPEVGDIYLARSKYKEHEGILWKMTVLQIIQHSAKKYIVCHKILAEWPSPQQLYLFDINGNEVDEDNIMKFYLCGKSKALPYLKIVT